jgi:type II secretory pathway pseudopilin PulG
MRNSASEDGYALTETLVAAAIAAGVVVATMTGMAQTLRSAHRADSSQQAFLEAQNISARLRSGIPSAQVAEAYPDWSIVISPVDRPIDPITGAVMTRAQLSYAGGQSFEIEFFYLEPGAVVDEP